MAAAISATILLFLITDPPLCSHIMAGLYFAESIRNSVFGGHSFIARKCDNVGHYILGLCNTFEHMAIMGENVYYL